jgi:prepilin-type processing-associated H-X9-DG protein
MNQSASDLRRKPAKVKVHVTTGEGVEIAWADGHASRYDFPYLRDRCPCAVCNDEREKKEKQKSTGMSALPMFKERVKARAAKPVGSYAIQIDFSDGHATGIYSFDYLRSICACAECATGPSA